MKHILNEMNDEERNSIRSQYTGTLSVQTGKFKQLVENKLGNAKPLVSEQLDSFTAFDEQEDEDNPNKKSKFRRHVEKHWSSHYPDLSDNEMNDFIDNLDDSPQIHSHFDKFDDEEFNEDMIDDVDYGGEDEEGEEASWMNESDDATLKEKIEKAIRNSVTNKEEIIDVLEKILREKKGVGYVTKDKVLKNFKK
jgi:hypothetical protein